MTDRQTLSQDMGREMRVVGFPFTECTIAGRTHIDVEVYWGPSLFIHDEHTVGLGEESTKSSQVFLLKLDNSVMYL